MAHINHISITFFLEDICVGQNLSVKEEMKKMIILWENNENKIKCQTSHCIYLLDDLVFCFYMCYVFA